jgi:hypothetical protein
VQLPDAKSNEERRREQRRDDEDPQAENAQRASVANAPVKSWPPCLTCTQMW